MASLLALAMIIPGLSYLFTQKLRTAASLKDKRLSQINGMLVIVGSVVSFLASKMSVMIAGQILFAFGCTMTISMRSLVTSMVDPEHLGILYTGISSVMYMGVLVGGPLLAKVFSWGMKLGDFWIGLPFLVAGGFLTSSLLAISAVQLDSGIEI